MQLKRAIVFVTGANRGIGKAFVEGLLRAGARTVYAGVRDLKNAAPQGSVPIGLDITNLREVAAAAKACKDVNLLINNAGIAAFSPLIGAPDTTEARAQMETNYFGTLNMCREFAPRAIVSAQRRAPCLTQPVGHAHFAVHRHRRGEVILGVRTTTSAIGIKKTPATSVGTPLTISLMQQSSSGIYG